MRKRRERERWWRERERVRGRENERECVKEVLCGSVIRLGYLTGDISLVYNCYRPDRSWKIKLDGTCRIAEINLLIKAIRENFYRSQAWLRNIMSVLNTFNHKDEIRRELSRNFWINSLIVYVVLCLVLLYTNYFWFAYYAKGKDMIVPPLELKHRDFGGISNRRLR